jgi:hypothetical protein
MLLRRITGRPERGVCARLGGLSALRVRSQGPRTQCNIGDSSVVMVLYLVQCAKPLRGLGLEQAHSNASSPSCVARSKGDKVPQPDQLWCVSPAIMWVQLEPAEPAAPLTTRQMPRFVGFQPAAGSHHQPFRSSSVLSSFRSRAHRFSTHTDTCDEPNGRSSQHRGT